LQVDRFVFSEVLKLMTASALRLTPYHFRDQLMHEVWTSYWSAMTA